MSKKTYEFNSCCQEFIPVLSLSQMVEKSPFLFRHLGKRRKKEKKNKNGKRKKPLMKEICVFAEKQKL